MIENIWNFVIGFKFNTFISIWLFWLPAAICLLGFTLDSIHELRKDLKERHENIYIPRLTVGKLLGRFISSFIPFINIFVGIAKLWTIAPEFLDLIFEVFGKILDIPLVPKGNKKSSI